MRSSIRLGRVAGIPVGAHWSLLVIGGLLTLSLATGLLPAAVPDAGSYWVAAVVGATAFFASILAHELAHALVARRYGQRVEDITLWLFGGMARLGSEAPSARAELLVALAGPGTSLGAGALSLGLAWAAATAGLGDLVVVVLTWLGLVNVVLAVFNLLPGAPLDGGRVLAAVLWMRHGDRARAQVRAAQAGGVVGWALIGFAVADLALGLGGATLWTGLIGWFVLSASREEERAARLRGVLEGTTVGDLMDPYPELVPDGLAVSDLPAHLRAPGRPAVVLLQRADGDIGGVLHLDDAAAVPPDRAGTVLLRDVGVAKPDLRTIGPDEAVVPAVFDGRLGRDPLVVLDGGRVVGLLGIGEVEAARDRLVGAPARR